MKCKVGRIVESRQVQWSLSEEVCGLYSCCLKDAKNLPVHVVHDVASKAEL